MNPVVLSGYPQFDLVWKLREPDARRRSPFRRCFRCGEGKSESDFHDSRTGQFSYCAECRRAYDRRYYDERGREARLMRSRARRAGAREWLDSLRRGVPCADCGETFPEPVMHWDHLPGEPKVDTVSSLARERSRDVALAEMQKCELVCANCHAIRTSRRRREPHGQSDVRVP